QPGVMQTLRGQGLTERPHDVVLANQGIEGSRPPFASQHEICHGGILGQVREPESVGRKRCCSTAAQARAGGMRRNQEAGLTSALPDNDYGCFVPDLTRFTAPTCEGTRQPLFNSMRQSHTEDYNARFPGEKSQ